MYVLMLAGHAFVCCDNGLTFTFATKYLFSSTYVREVREQFL